MGIHNTNTYIHNKGKPTVMTTTYKMVNIYRSIPHTLLLFNAL